VNFYALIYALPVMLRLIRWKYARFVFAVRAAHQYGFVPEAVRRAEGIFKKRGEKLFAFRTQIFFFRRVLCRYESGCGKRYQ
jgi:hypothetical protein